MDTFKTNLVIYISIGNSFKKYFLVVASQFTFNDKGCKYIIRGHLGEAAYLGPDLVAALAGLDVDDLSHVWCWCWSGGEWRLAAEGARESPRSRDQATSGSGPDQARPAATVPLPRSFRGQPAATTLPLQRSVVIVSICHDTSTG